MTISDELGVPDSYGRALMGQNDPTITKYYKDMSRPRIVGKLAYYHLAILREFDTINIFNYLVDHLCKNFFAPQHRLFFSMHKISVKQDELYRAYENLTTNLLEKRDVKILNF